MSYHRNNARRLARRTEFVKQMRIGAVRAGLANGSISRPAAGRRPDSNHVMHFTYLVDPGSMPTPQWAAIPPAERMAVSWMSLVERQHVGGLN